MASVSYKQLRTSERAEIAQHFRVLSKELAGDDLTEYVLNGIEAGSIPPYLTSFWLEFDKSPKAVWLAINQRFSSITRRIGLKHLGRLLRDAGNSSALHDISEKKSIIDLFDSLSVHDVKLLVRALSFAVSSHLARRKEWLKIWLAEIYDDLLRSQGPEKRSFSPVHMSMLPNCTTGYIEKILSDSRYMRKKQNSIWASKSTMRLLIDQHTTAMQGKVIAWLYSDEAEPSYTELLFNTFPSGDRNTNGLTPPMEFALNVLRRCVAHEGPPVKVSNQFIFDNVVFPLLRRLYKKPRSAKHLQTKEEVIRYIQMYVDRHPVAKSYIRGRGEQSLVWFTAKSWLHAPSMFKSHLWNCFKITNSLKLTSLDGYQEVLMAVPSGKRPELLSLLLCSSVSEAKNIDLIEVLVQSNIQKWPLWVFTCIPREDAFILFSRISQARTDDFLSPDNADRQRLVNKVSTPTVGKCDAGLLLAFLEQGKEGALDRATKVVEERKKSATTAREQNARATYVGGALLHAIVSGSLELYLDTVRWTKRYLKDTLTVYEVYGGDIFRLHDSIEMLVLVPDLRLSSGRTDPKHIIDAESTVSEWQNKLSCADEILLTLFSFVCSSMREPSFRKHHWLTILRLPYQVARKRIQRLNAINDSDFQQAETLLEATKKLLLDIERQALEFKLETPYYFKRYSHPSLGRGVLSSSVKVRPEILSFFNDLAMERDKMWSEFRIRDKPATTVLPLSFARGLPLTDLLLLPSGDEATIFDLTSGANREYLPYIASRAREVVFMPGNIALSSFPEDEEIMDATVYFCDSYPIALRTFVLSQEPQDRTSAAQSAWKHAITDLTGTRMTAQEASRHWSKIFGGAIGDIASGFRIDIATKEQAFSLPSDFIADEPIEWNPLYACRPPTKDKILPLVVIDWFFAATLEAQEEYSGRTYRRIVTVQQFWKPSPPNIVMKGFKPRPIWDFIHAKAKKAWTPEADVGIASALLYLDAQFESSHRILAQPFPSMLDIRFPNMYLDEAFLMREDVRPNDALNVLSRSTKLIPPVLLEKLATTALSDLQSTSEKSFKLAEKERTTFRILKLMLKSDATSLAFGHIEDVILNRPQSSSWHRQILTPSTLRHARHEEVRKFIREFAEKILSRLKSQQEIAKEQANHAGTRPYVKITTVKLFIQLLGKEDYISSSDSVEILNKLAQSANQRDLRIAVNEILIEMLCECKTPKSSKVAENILSFFETQIEYASAFNELQPYSETEWQMADTEKLPQPFPDQSAGPPLIMFFIRALHPIAEKNCIIKGQEFFKRIIEPCLQKSCEWNKKWMQLFCHKYGIEEMLDTLPIPPTHLHTLHELLPKHWEWLPADWLRLIHDLALVVARPSRIVRDLNRKLGKPEKSAIQPTAESHWLKIWHSKFDRGVVRLLERDLPEHSTSDGITLSMVQDLIFEMYKTMILEDSYHTFRVPFSSTSNLSRLDSDGEGYQPLRKIYEQEMSTARWIRKVRPILSRVIALVDSLRTPEWQQNPSRHPSYLPSTFTWRLSLLALPDTGKSHIPLPNAICQTYVQDLLTFLTTHVIDPNGKTPYHNRFIDFEGVILFDAEVQHAMQIIEHLVPTINVSNLELKDYLCIQLIHDLLEKEKNWISEEGRLEFRTRLQGLTREWSRCEDEILREIGRQIERFGVP